MLQVKELFCTFLSFPFPSLMFTTHYNILSDIILRLNATWFPSHANYPDIVGTELVCTNRGIWLFCSDISPLPPPWDFWHGWRLGMKTNSFPPTRSKKGRGLTPAFVKKKDEIIAGKSGFPSCYSWYWRSESVSLPGYILFYIRNAAQKGWCTAWQTPFFIGQVPPITVANRINGLHWWQLLKPAHDQQWSGLSKMKGRWGSPTGHPMAVGYQGVKWQDKGNGFKLQKGRLRLDWGLHVRRQLPKSCTDPGHV